LDPSQLSDEELRRLLRGFGTRAGDERYLQHTSAVQFLLFSLTFIGRFVLAAHAALGLSLDTA
jgi:hypothetical protein